MIFTIDSENNITAVGTDAAIPENAQQFGGQKELGKLAADWPAERLVDIWNSLPGVKTRQKVHESQHRGWPYLEGHPEPRGGRSRTRTRTAAHRGQGG